MISFSMSDCSSNSKWACRDDPIELLRVAQLEELPNWHTNRHVQNTVSLPVFANKPLPSVFLFFSIFLSYIHLLPWNLFILEIVHSNPIHHELFFSPLRSDHDGFS